MADYHLECGRQCSLRDGQPFSSDASSLLADGVSFRQIIARGLAAQPPVRLTLSSIGNHKKHVIVSASEAPAPHIIAGRKATNIEIIEAIIQKGFANQKNWKPTIGDTMKAMDMWFRLTQGNPFDELLDTLAAAATGDEDVVLESSAAVGLPDETAGPAEDDE